MALAGCAGDRSRSLHAQERYARMKSTLEKIEASRPDLSFEQFAERLGIGRTVFDRIYTNKPSGVRRVYHFDGFALDINLEDRDGKLFVDWFMLPALYWDGLAREERMKKYDQSLSDYFREKQRALDEIRKTNTAE
jgi:hypothetical protein